MSYHGKGEGAVCAVQRFESGKNIEKMFDVFKISSKGFFVWKWKVADGWVRGR